MTLTMERNSRKMVMRWVWVLFLLEFACVKQRGRVANSVVAAVDESEMNNC